MSTSQATGTNNRRRSGGGGQGSRNRNNNNRNRSGDRPNRRPAKAPEPSFGQKFLKVITFGLAGGSPAKPAPTRDRANSSGSGGGRNRNDGNRGSGDSSDRRQSRDRDRNTRSPEIVEVTNPRLYVGNLSYDATESDLFELFTGAGSVQNAEVVSHKYSQRSKGYAFVEMASIEEARRAVDVLHDQDFMGRKLVVSGAKSRGPHEGSESTGTE